MIIEKNAILSYVSIAEEGKRNLDKSIKLKIEINNKRKEK